jgi:hypothetical protein
MRCHLRSRKKDKSAHVSLRSVVVLRTLCLFVFCRSRKSTKTPTFRLTDDDVRQMITLKGTYEKQKTILGSKVPLLAKKYEEKALALMNDYLAELGDILHGTSAWWRRFRCTTVSKISHAQARTSSTRQKSTSFSKRPLASRQLSSTLSRVRRRRRYSRIFLEINTVKLSRAHWNLSGICSPSTFQAR